MLEWLIIDDRKWPMTLEDPVRHKVSKLRFAVHRSLSIVSNAFQGVHDLAVTGFDIADKVCSRIFFAFTSEDDRGVPSPL